MRAGSIFSVNIPEPSIVPSIDLLNIDLLKKKGEEARKKEEEVPWNQKGSSRIYKGPSFKKMVENIPALSGKMDPEPFSKYLLDT